MLREPFTFSTAKESAWYHPFFTHHMDLHRQKRVEEDRGGGREGGIEGGIESGSVGGSVESE